MAISAVFSADFTSFQNAVQQATAKLKDLNDGSVNVSSALTKMGNAFSGTKIIQDANIMVKAINDGGGAAVLTTKEMERVNATVTEAIAKYRALGGTAPPAMQALADATTRTESSMDRFTGMLGSVNGLLGGLGVGLSIGAVVGFGRALLDDADHLVKLHDKTEITLQDLQRLQVAGDDAGVSIDDLALAVNKLQKNIGTDNTGASEALKKLGLDLRDIRALTPENQFYEIAAALKEVKDPAEQVAIAVALFGKGGAEVLPVIKRGLDDVRKAAVGMGDDTVRNLDAVGDAFTAAWRAAKGFFANALVMAFHPDLFGLRAGKIAIDDAAAAADRLAPKIPKLMPEEVVVNEKEFDRAMVDSTKHIDQAASALAAHNAALEAVDKKIQYATRDTGSLTSAQVESIKQYKLLGLSNDDIALKLGISALAIKALDDAMTFAAKAAQTLYNPLGSLATTIPDLTTRSGRFRDEWESLASTTETLSGGLTVAGDTLDHTLIPAFGALPNVVAGATDKIKEATVAAESLGDTIKGNLSAALDNIPETLIKAFEGGGGLMGALKAIGVQVAEAIAKPLLGALTKGITQALNSIGKSATETGSAISAGMGAGTAATLAFTGVGIAFVALANKSASEAQNMQTQMDQLAASLLSLATTEETTNAHGDQMTLMMSVLGDAFEATGRTAQEAGEAFRQVLIARTEGPDAMAAAIANLMGPLRAYHDNLAAIAKAQEIVTGKVTDFAGVVAEVGVGIPDFLQPMLDDLMAAPGLTDAVKASIAGLRDSAVPDFAKMESLAKSYGIEIDQLGPKFQAAHVTADAQKWISDFDKLMTAGADFNGVLSGMADEASHVVQESIKFGTDIPENMKPMLQALIDSGQLLDESGNKIEDINKLKFGTAVKTDVDKLADAIKDLSDAIAGIPKKLGDINNSKVTPIHVPIVYDDPGYRATTPPGPIVPAEGASTGGFVSATGIQHFSGGGSVLNFRPRGSDTVPAMLTPGEMVLTPAQQQRLLKGGEGGGDLASALSRMEASQRRRDVFLKEIIEKAVKAAVQRRVA